MHVPYPITEETLLALERYPWLRANYSVGKPGTTDAREVTRLLLNTHYPHIARVLGLIDRIGDKGGNVIAQILKANDGMNLSRFLGELYLFSYLESCFNGTVKVVEPIGTGVSPDIIVALTDFEAAIEVFSPSDLFGFQVFDRYLSSIVRYVPVTFGFLINVDVKSDNLYHPLSFPEYKEVYSWLDVLSSNLAAWLRKASVGETMRLAGPRNLLQVSLTLERRDDDPNLRTVLIGGATRSTDTSLYFERSEHEILSKSPWIPKIREKLAKQQAGLSDAGRLRILALNFTLTDTADFSFLKEATTLRNLHYIVHIAAQGITPYPPYDVVLPCVLGFDCGFAQPAILTPDRRDTDLDRLARLRMSKPIMDVPTVSTDEAENLLI
jgi:hypothetical protein